jgi:hypothetical protein
MLRYYAIATLIVLSIAVGVTAWQHRELIRILISPTSLPTPPKPQTPDTPGPARDVPLRMSAPWALSTLPECLEQTSESRGSLAYVLSKMPGHAVRVGSGTTLTFGPCTIFVAGDELEITRGLDRLTVPPHVQLYRADDGLAVLRVDGRTGDLRVYTTKHVVQ